MRWVTLAIILMMGCSALGQVQTASHSAPDSIDAPSRAVTKSEEQPAPAMVVEEATPAHRFWDRENILLFSGVAVFRGLDYASTRNFEARGRPPYKIKRIVQRQAVPQASAAPRRW